MTEITVKNCVDKKIAIVISDDKIEVTIENHQKKTIAYQAFTNPDLVHI